MVGGGHLSLLLLCPVSALTLNRRALLLSTPLAATEPCGAAASQCVQDRCALRDLLASDTVPVRLREALQLADTLVGSWNELTSECSANVCKVTSQRVRSEYLSETSPLMTLASDGVLRDAATLTLVRSADREAYERNARRYESSVKYTANCARLADFDPALPTFSKGAYVPQGLTDAQGNLLGTNLENARDFALDARDALVVVCSFIFMDMAAATTTVAARAPIAAAPVGGRSGRASMSAAAASWRDALADALAAVDPDVVRRAARSIAAPSWEEIGTMLPEAERSLQAARDSGRGPADVAADVRLFDSPDGTVPCVTLWRDQSAWCPYCQKVLLQLEEKRVPYAVRRAPMKCYAGGELQKPGAFLELSKAGTLPVAIIDGQLYPDSASILDAVETKFPERPLVPSGRAGRRAFDEAAALEQAFSSAWLVWLTTPPWVPGDAQRAASFTESLDAIERHLESMSSSASGDVAPGPYFVGAHFSLADVKIASFLERAAASVPFYRGLKVRTGGRWPAIERWFEAMERRPAYAALRGDYYTHCLDLPPQLSPFGLSRSRNANAQRYASEIDGSDKTSWALPLPRGEQRLEPVPVSQDDDDAAARCAAAAALWRNHEQVTRFACRGRGLRAAVRLPLLTTAAIGAVTALAVSSAAHGSASQTFQWSATALVMYDLLGTRSRAAG